MHTRGSKEESIIAILFYTPSCWINGLNTLYSYNSAMSMIKYVDVGLFYMTRQSFSNTYFCTFVSFLYIYLFQYFLEYVREPRECSRWWLCWYSYTIINIIVQYLKNLSFLCILHIQIHSVLEIYNIIALTNMILLPSGSNSWHF